MQAVLRRRAKEEREKGHTVKLGFLKIQVNRGGNITLMIHQKL
jgi:hypothetical protein